MRGYVGDQRHHVAGRGRPARQRASLGFGTTGQPETYVIAPDGVAVCGSARAGRPQAELDAWLQAARSGRRLRLRRCVGAVARRSRVVVIVAVVVLVVRSRPDKLARRARRAARAAARVPGVRRAVGRRQQLARVARHPRRHRDAASRPASPTPRSATRTSRPTASTSCATPSNCGLGVVAWGVPVLALVIGGAAASCSRCGGGAARRGSPRPPRTRTSSPRARTARGWSTTTRTTRERLRPGGARGRARLPAAVARRPRRRAASPATSTTTPTASLHDDYTARAAAVIRSLEDGADRTPADPPAASQVDAVPSRSAASSCSRSWPRSCSRTRSGQRRPGQTITGNAQAATGTTIAPIPGRRSRPQARRPRTRRATRAHLATPRVPAPAPRLQRRDPGVRRRGPARPDPARAADLRWLGGRAARAAGHELEDAARRCSTAAARAHRRGRSGASEVP